MDIQENKVVLITGGSSGIGKAAAAKFLEQKAAVYITGRNRERLEAAQTELRSIHDSIEIIQMNVAVPAECKRAIDTVLAKEHRLDVLVNSAGVSYSGPSIGMTEQIWDETMDINLKGTYFMCQYAIPALADTQGSIVNLSSDAGLVGNKELAIYCASKGGVTLLTKSLALELAPQKIRVNAVCPGEVDTPMLVSEMKQLGYATREELDAQYLKRFPQGENARYIRAEEVAECICFLASKEKVEAITGACLSIDFGTTSGY